MPPREVLTDGVTVTLTTLPFPGQSDELLAFVSHLNSEDVATQNDIRIGYVAFQRVELTPIGLQPAFAITADPSSTAPGGIVTFTATLSAPSGANTQLPVPTGSVNFIDQFGTLLCITELSAGVGSCSAPVYGYGTTTIMDTITSTYSGDSNYPLSTATTVVTVVAPQQPSLTESVSCTSGVVSVSGTAAGPAGIQVEVVVLNTYDAGISCGSWTNSGSAPVNGGITVACQNNTGQSSSTSWQGQWLLYPGYTVSGLTAWLQSGNALLTPPGEVSAGVTCQ